MNNIDKPQIKSLFRKIGGEMIINNIIDIFYLKMLADYRVSRFFNTQNENEQKTALKAFIVASYGGNTCKTNEDIKTLLDDFFIVAFAKSKRKSFITGSDFGFFGLLIEQDHPETHLLCPSHAHLLKFMPDDFHYDVMIEHLDASLQQLNTDKNLIEEMLEITENARPYLLGRQSISI